MPEISIDRLTLQVPGFSETEGKRLALAVADGLAAAALSRETGDVKTLRVDLTAVAGVERDLLARQIVSEIIRQLERLP
jgi:hypothetical protein